MKIFSRFFHTISLEDRLIRYFLGAAVFLVPILFYPSSNDPYETTKVFVFGILVCTAFVTWWVQNILRRETRFIWTRLHTLVAIFTAVVVFSGFFSSSFTRSFLGSSSSFAGTVPVTVFVAVFFFLIVQVIRETKDRLCILYSFFAGAGLSLLIMLMQSFSLFIFPWEGTKNAAFQTLSSSSITPPVFLGVVGILLFSLFFIYRSLVIRLILGGGMALVLLGMAVYDAAFSLLAFAIGLFVVIVFFTIKSKEIKTWWIFVPTGLLAVVILLVFLPTYSWFGNVIPQEVVLDQGSGWSVTVDTAKSRPFLGSGPQTFVDAFQQYRPLEFNDSSLWGLRFVRSSNQWFEQLTTTGILGFAAFIGILALFVSRFTRFILRTQPKTPDWFLTLSAGSGLLLITFVGFLYSWNFILLFLWWTLLALTSSAFISEKNQKTIAFKRSRSQTMLTVLIFLVALIGSVLFAVFGIRVWNGERLQAKALELSYDSSTLVQDLREMAERSVSWNAFSASSEFLLADAYAIEALGFAQNSDDVENILSIRDKSIEHINEGIAKDPDNAMTYESAAEVYRILQPLYPESDRMIAELYEQAAEHDPYNPNIHSELGQAYLAYVQRVGVETSPNELEKAVSAFTKSLELKSNFIDPALFLSLADETAGRIEEAIERLEATHEQYPLAVEVTLTLAGLYQRGEQHDKAVELLQEVSALSASNFEAHAQIGTIYENLGLLSEALQEYLTAQQINPANEFVNNKVIELSQDGNSGEEAVTE
ncbi:hypothetical protein ACFL0L_00500 [Patescibacteria group bacterium]